MFLGVHSVKLAQCLRSVMSDMKFACPHCRQHVQCDASHAGRKIACPNCTAWLRIPRPAASGSQLVEAELLSPPTSKTQPIESTAADSGAAPPPVPKLKSTQKVSQTEAVPEAADKPGPAAEPKLVPGKAAAVPKPKSPATVAVPPHAASDKPQPTIQISKKDDAVEQAQKAKPSALKVTVAPASLPNPKTEPAVVHCICPVCQSELRVASGSTEAESKASPPTAELVRKGAAPIAGGPAAEAPETKPALPRAATSPGSAKVSEAQAARPGGEMKPRLEYIMSGKPPSAAAYPSPSTGEKEAKPDKLAGEQDRKQSDAPTDEAG